MCKDLVADVCEQVCERSECQFRLRFDRPAGEDRELMCVLEDRLPDRCFPDSRDAFECEGTRAFPELDHEPLHDAPLELSADRRGYPLLHHEHENARNRASRARGCRAAETVPFADAIVPL